MILKRPGIQYVPVQRGEYMCKIPRIKVEVQQVFNRSKVLEKHHIKAYTTNLEKIWLWMPIYPSLKILTDDPAQAWTYRGRTCTTKAFLPWNQLVAAIKTYTQPHPTPSCLMSLYVEKGENFAFCIYLLIFIPKWHANLKKVFWKVLSTE